MFVFKIVWFSRILSVYPLKLFRIMIISPRPSTIMIAFHLRISFLTNFRLNPTQIKKLSRWNLTYCWNVALLKFGRGLVEPQVGTSLSSRSILSTSHFPPTLSIQYKIILLMRLRPKSKLYFVKLNFQIRSYGNCWSLRGGDMG